MMLKMIKKVRSSSFQKFIVLTTSVLAFGTVAHAAPIELTMQHMEQPPSRVEACLLYTSPSPRDRTRSRMPSSA